ncbi:hypothetical protein B7P43_G11418, partial [Cryptotermes secundus]
MDLLEDPSFKIKYQKSKLKVKLWESEFRKSRGRNPSKMDIRAASQKVKEAYKLYYQLKTLALQDSLMDITCSDDRENITTSDISEIKHSITSVEADKVIDQSDQIRQHRIALADIQNEKDVDSCTCDSEKVSHVEECVRDVLHERSSEDLKDVWGSHLNKNAEKVLDSATKTFSQRSACFHFSEKLFIGSKFSKKNPRKSRSFSQPSKSVENDGFQVLPCFEVKKMSSEYMTCGHQEDMPRPSTDNRNAAESTSTPHSALSINGLLEEKLTVVRNSTQITNQAVSAIHRAVLTSDSCEQKCTPSRTVDKGWLDRCTKANSLEYQVTPVNDSGIESMESSTVTDQCSIIEDTPKLLQPVSAIASQLPCTKPSQCLTLPDVTGNEKRKMGVAVSDDSDEDIIYNSEESENEEQMIRMRRITCGKKRKLYASDADFPGTSAKNKDTFPEAVPTLAGAEDTLIEIPSIADINKIAEAIVSTEKNVEKKKRAVSSKLTKREILERKMCAGQANDNFVRINIKKKVYVRGKKNNSYSKYKKAEWKKKKKMVGSAVDDDAGSSGVLKCFKCGDIGHFARNCLNFQGDKLLPQDEAEEDDSPFPTLEEVEAMAAEPIYASRRKVTASFLMTSQHGNEQNTETCCSFDSVTFSDIKPLYELKED